MGRLSTTPIAFERFFAYRLWGPLATTIDAAWQAGEPAVAASKPGKLSG
jgi:hypothetical protein